MEKCIPNSVRITKIHDIPRKAASPQARSPAPILAQRIRGWLPGGGMRQIFKQIQIVGGVEISFRRKDRVLPGGPGITGKEPGRSHAATGPTVLSVARCREARDPFAPQRSRSIHAPFRAEDFTQAATNCIPLSPSYTVGKSTSSGALAPSRAATMAAAASL